MAHEQEQGGGDGEVSGELCVAARHAVALAVGAGGSLLFDQALKGEVERLACQLPREQQRDLGLPRRPHQRRVCYTEPLRHQGQPGAQVGYGVRWVLSSGREGRA